MKLNPIVWPKGSESYDNDMLLEIAPGVVALLNRGRNAWNSTWVQHYFRNARMFSEIASAKRDAERLRGPGNVFYITQVPAILLRGLKTSIVLADPREDVPFRYFHGLGVDETPSRYGAWLNGIYPGIATRDAVDAFAADSGNWTGRDRDPGDLVSGVLPSAARLVLPGSLQALISRPRGSAVPLDWAARAEKSRYSFGGVERVADGWRAMLAAVVDPQADQVRTVESLSRFRRGLSAQPRGIWRERRDVAREAHREAAVERLLLTMKLADARKELEAARQARLKPEGTAAGLRAQRLRVEQAVDAVTEIEDRLEQLNPEGL